MKYQDAKKLHNGDEVTIKKTGEVLMVIRAYQPNSMNLYQKNQVFIECDDGNTYYHTDVK